MAPLLEYIYFGIEALRTDSLMFFDLKIAQIMSVLMAIAGLILIIVSLKKSKLYHMEMSK